MSDQLTNIIGNTIGHVDPRQTDRVFGLGQDVGMQILISKILMWVTKNNKISVTELVEMHLAATPFVGGLQVMEGINNRGDNGWADDIKISIAQIPSLYFGKYVQEIIDGKKIMSIPRVGLMTLFCILVSKVLTKPVLRAFAKEMGGDSAMTKQFAAIMKYYDDQRVRSVLFRDN